MLDELLAEEEPGKPEKREARELVQASQSQPSSGRITEPLPVEVPGSTKTTETTTTTSEVVVEEGTASVEESLVVEEEQPPNKMVVLVVGEKGTGKTVTALSFPGEVCVLSFDRKAMPIKMSFYNGDKRIHVFDIVKFVDWRPEKITETSARAFDAMEKALEKCRELGVDWVVIDATEIMEQLAEMYMRYRHGLGPIEGIRNLNIWKERRWILRDVHNKSLEAAKKGVVYTVYPTWQERVVAGEIVDRRQEPRWLDIILFETDVVLWTKYDDSTKRFLVEVQTSKYDKIFPTGHVFDVTNNPLGSQVNI